MIDIKFEVNIVCWLNDCAFERTIGYFSVHIYQLQNKWLQFYISSIIPLKEFIYKYNCIT